MAEECNEEIQSAKKEDIALIKAVQASNAEEASAFMTTLDKLESFKRYSLALIFIIIFGGALSLFGAIILALVVKGQYDQAIEAAKWGITLVSGTVGVIVGFYFGSNAVPPEKVA